ncbi:MAG TPA: ArgR family transcriptional regulator [Spirochaetales bacterium]|nr:ArgR family transcriptional regulator [Spirochaetales bacterium]
MKERLERLKAVRVIIKSNRIDSQDQLLQLLAEQGFSVTQATLSRDLKYLKVGKVSDGHAGYYYTVPSDEERRESERHYIQDFLRGYVSIDWNLNMAVVRTFSGHSDSVALAIDNMGLEEVLGTIAGRDNVVFVALREGVTGEAFIEAMKKKVPDLEAE